MTLRLAALAQGWPLRLAALAQGRPRRLAALARGRRRVVFVAAGTVAFIMTGGSSSVLACPMCFGAEETSMIDGTKIGIFVLLAITLGVQGAFAGFFFYLRGRAKRVADADLDSEWSELQGPSRTS